MESNSFEIINLKKFMSENSTHILNIKKSSNLIIDSLINEDFTIDIAPNIDCVISCLFNEIDSNIILKIDIAFNSNVKFYCADFNKGKSKINLVANLNGEKARFECLLSSLSAKNDNKDVEISVNHNASYTYAKVNNYGVCKDMSKLLFAGVSKINNGMIKSETYQNARIMNFDDNSDGIAKPILKIDENDVVASHAAVVGKINDEHMFYLTSRGIDENTAKNLIIYGYLKPVLIGFNEVFQIKISKIMEGNI